MKHKNVEKDGDLADAPKVERLAVASLSQLEQLSNGRPLNVELTVGGQPIMLTGRRLKPAEVMEVQLLLESALPPMLPTKEGEPERYDLRDEGYRRRVEMCRRKARALALVSAFPLFGEKVPIGAPLEQVVAAVEGANLDDDLLEALFRRVLERVVSVDEYVDFTSGSNSPRN